MASTMMQLVFLVLFSSSMIMVSHAHPGGVGCGFGWGIGGGGGGDGYDSLSPYFYDFTCPQANIIVLSVLENAIAQDPRMAASILRLHFHDCFVQGCDASLLLDDSPSIRSEKNAKPNVNSLRGFEVIDEIKARLEEACPGVVSCADILALAARAATVLSGGPSWELPLGRRDSTTASIKLANNNIPAPNFTLPRLISSFRRQGLDETDLVSLSGSHTIGMARCFSFKQRLYNQNSNNQPDMSLEKNYLLSLRSICPPSGGDSILSPLDYSTPRTFDNTYYKLIMGNRGLLFTDQVLLSGGDPNIAGLVKAYAQDEVLFFSHFANSIVKMGTTSPLLGSKGEIRRNCRRVNSY